MNSTGFSTGRCPRACSSRDRSRHGARLSVSGLHNDVSHYTWSTYTRPAANCLWGSSPHLPPGLAPFAERLDADRALIFVPDSTCVRFAVYDPFEPHDEEPNKVCWGLLRRRNAWCRRCAAVSLALSLTRWPSLRSAPPTLPAVSDPVRAVCWSSRVGRPITSRTAIAEFKQNHYARLFVTGIPLQQGAPLSEYKNYAYLAPRPW